jgi:chaperone modulatory protein CbpM
MSDSSSPRLIIGGDIPLTLVEMCQVCRVSEEEIRAFVLEGVLEPEGDRPEEWRFAGSSIGRARTAYRISRDLEVNLAGIALALNLLDEIATLRARLDAFRRFNDPGSEGA